MQQLMDGGLDTVAVDMNKLAIIFVILIVIMIAIEAALLLKIVNFPINLGFLSIGGVVEKKVDIAKVAPAGGEVLNVSLTDSGFIPDTLKVKLGDKVIWTNNGSETVEISSDDHPTHELYPFLNLGPVEPTSMVRLIFRKTGTFTYHNHLNPSQKGTIIVE